MRQLAKPFSLSACALAAAVLVSACGGGSSAPDTVAPTVAITDNVASGATATGPVTFTFTFSEDVGTSFTVEDLVITGGTAGTLTKTDATHFSLVVTPTGTTGTIAVSVAAAKFNDIANNQNTASASLSQAFSVTVATAPTTAAPTPTPLAANVISLFSDAYTNLSGTDFFPNWGQSSVVTDFPIAGNATKKVTNLNYQGIALAAPIDVSAMSSLHIDVWSAVAGTVSVGIITSAAASGGAALVKELPQTLVAGWNSLDIPLTSFTGPNLTKIDQLDLVGSGTVFYDNLYFWKAPSAPVSCGTTAPTCAPTTVIPSGAVTIYSDSVTAAGFVPRPDWGQTVTESEVTIASNKSLKYGFLGGGFNTPGAYEGLQWDPVNVSTKGKLHLDLWSPDLTSLKISLISAGKENAFTQAVTAGSWNSVDIDMSNYTVADKTAIIQIKLEAATAGTLYVDNIHFWGTASAPVGGTPNPTAAAGSAGTVTLPLLTAAYLGDFGASGNGVFAADYVGGIDTNGNHATWGTAVTSGLASNGNIGYFQDPAISPSSQKIDENGWIAGLIDNAGGVPSLFRYVVLTKPASTFSSSYMGLFVNAPNNGTVNVSSYGSIKFRLWGPAEMYQQSNLSPTLELKLTGPKITGCTATGSGATEIKKTFVADQKIGAASTYKLSLAGWTVGGLCGTDTTLSNANVIASVLANLAQVVVTVPGSSFNFTNPASVATQYPTGVNLGPIIFTAN